MVTLQLVYIHYSFTLYILLLHHLSSLLILFNSQQLRRISLIRYQLVSDLKYILVQEMTMKSTAFLTSVLVSILPVALARLGETLHEPDRSLFVDKSDLEFMKLVSSHSSKRLIFDYHVTLFHPSSSNTYPSFRK